MSITNQNSTAVEAEERRFARTVRESQSEYSEICLPNDANLLGNMLGGHVMHLVDVCGAIAAMRHARCPVVTASVDQMTFLHPVHIGELVKLKSHVNRVFRTSMEVGVKVWVENLQTGQQRHTSSAYLTFVAVDKDGRRVVLPPIVPETDEEKRRYAEAAERRAYRLASKDKTEKDTSA
ncbi:MAG: acyl-CoA thioesterase [Acidobacteriaceae bacterium]|nr:acyl-CoA thioesterase [Acidobacteriaceae bacterium]